MPDERKERVKKRQEQYREGITAFDEVTTQDLNYREKWAVGSLLGSLTNMIDSYSPYDRAGNRKQEQPPVLSEEALVTITTLYKQVRTAIETLNAKNSAACEAAPQNAAGRALKDRLKRETEQNEKLDAILKKDHEIMEKALIEARERGRQVTIHAIFEAARINAGYKVKPGSIKTSSSGNLNERIPLTLTHGDEPEQKGFFTKDNRTAEGVPGEKKLKKTLEKYKGRMDFLSEGYVKALLGQIYQRDKELLGCLRTSPAELAFENWQETLTKMAGIHLPGQNVNLFEKIQNAGDFHRMVDVLHDYLEVFNVISIHKTALINPKGRINRRNSAMSRMADYLGCPDLLARSENVKLKVNGKTVRGTFMKEAEGWDYRNISAESPFLKTNIYSAENLNLKKQIADLQILDYLSGNPDRHGGNMFYQFQEEGGTAKLIGIQGIDNDLSFGRFLMNRQVMQVVLPKEMKVITSDMALRVMDLNESKLRGLLYGYELTEKEMNAAVRRLNTLKGQIVAGSEEYAKGYGKGHLAKGHIKIVSDEELDLLPFSDLCTETNLFKKVYDKACTGKDQIQMCEDWVKYRYSEDVYHFTFGNHAEMLELSDKLESDKVWHQKADNDYNVMTRRIKLLTERMAEFTGPVMDGNNQVSPELRDLKQEMEQALLQVNRYISYKDQKTSGEEWRNARDINDPDHKQSKTERRYRHALRCRDLLARKLREYSGLDERLQKYREFLPLKQDLIRNAGRAKDLQENEYLFGGNVGKLREARKESHEKRCSYILNEYFQSVNLADDPAEKRELEIKKIIVYGFGINSLDPEQREKVKAGLRAQNGEQNFEEDDIALQRALSLYLLKSAGQGNAKNTIKAADDLMKTDYFTAFYQEVKDDLIGEKARTASSVVYPSKVDTGNYLRRLEDIRKEMHPEQIKVAQENPIVSSAPKNGAPKIKKVPGGMKK